MSCVWVSRRVHQASCIKVGRRVTECLVLVIQYNLQILLIYCTIIDMHCHLVLMNYLIIFCLQYLNSSYIMLIFYQNSNSRGVIKWKHTTVITLRLIIRK